MADWYSLGGQGRGALGRADIPDQLARFLFLEEVLGERRVLLVGETAYALSRYLKELGARKVVCALFDAERVEAIRREGAPAGVDVRLVRPGALPGDDGAFDLVVDFGLPYEDERSRELRLFEIERLLSDDGFALTALPSGEHAGLQGLFGEEPPAPLVEYRELAEALVDQFEVVEVYFQSLLLGYFFGSFEVDPGEDGIAPHTGLMGDEPEPATTWMFAFGNAVPVLEDVTLVQLPFAPLVEQVRERLSKAPAVEVGGAPADPTALEALAHYKRENARKEQALLQLASRIPELKHQVDTLLLALEARTREREDLTAGVALLQSALLERDADIIGLHAELERAAAHAHALEERLSGGVDVLHERETWLEATRAEVAHLEAELLSAQQALAASEESQQQLAQQVERAQSEKARMRERLVNAEEAAREARAKQADLKEQLEATRARSKPAAREEGGEEELAKLEKLASGVNRLMAERDGLKQRAQKATLRSEEAAKELTLAKQELEELQRRLKAQQASLETRGRELGKAKEQLADVTAQRDTLQRVLTARDRELAEVKDELAQAVAERERLEEQAKAEEKARADLERESASVVERLRKEHLATRDELERTTKELLALVEECERLAQRSDELRAENRELHERLGEPGERERHPSSTDAAEG